MSTKVLALAALVVFHTPAQTPAPGSRTVPLYQVTVIERTVKAVNYQYRSGPTRIDFRGTVLLPHAKGEATVESKQGRTEIDAAFENLEAPTRFGREYLTYVLWAITPDGHPRNLGEVVAGPGNKSKLRVTTDLSTFGMIVSAEPYAAVRQPGDVVILENEIRPDTLGKTEPIAIKYELMPRGHYTYNVPANVQASEGSGPKVSMDQYEALVQLYQARNAVQIARAAAADRYASETFAKAERQMAEAENLYSRKAGSRAIVTAAREAAQTAEDARLIAEKKSQEEKLADARGQAEAERRLREKAQAEAQAARDEAARARARLANQQAAARQPEPAVQYSAPVSAERAAAPAQSTAAPAPNDAAQRNYRMRLLQYLQAAGQTRDTPRGVLLSLPDSYFAGAAVRPGVYDQLNRVAAAVRDVSGLRIEIEGHTDSTGTPESAVRRAEAVRDLLIARGVPASAISARGMGSSRPIASNATAAGRAQNRRVEVIISGEPLGNLAYWDRTYSVAPR